LDLEDFEWPTYKATVFAWPLTRVGEITYFNFEVDDMARIILSLHHLDVRKWEKAIPARYH